MECGKIISALIILVSVTALSGCLCSNISDLTGGSTVSEGICNPPYIAFEDTCCIDRDGNGICDRDETVATSAPETTITEEPTTTIEAPTTTEAEAPATTLAPAIACSMNSDCGQQINYTKCSNGNAVMYWETPSCTKPGTPEAACIMKAKTTPYKTCKDYEACIGGNCVNETLVTCEDACLDKGYGEWYCNSVSTCTGVDVKAAYGDISCSPGGADGYCCCKADSATITGSSSTTTTTLAPGGLTHKECVGALCKTVSGAGVNECFASFQCSGGLEFLTTTTTLLIKTHKECIGSSCEIVFGAGINECTKDLQCAILGPTLTTSPPFHKDCVGTTCMWVPGTGSNHCTNNIQCIATVTSITIPHGGLTVPTTLYVPKYEFDLPEI